VTYVPGTTYNKEVDIAKASDAAAKADAVVLCLGEWAYAKHRATSPNLTLPDAAAQPRPESSWKLRNLSFFCSRKAAHASSAALPMLANAIVMVYNPGNEGGQAIADILFGDVNPSGKLPITYPRSRIGFSLRPQSI